MNEAIRLSISPHFVNKLNTAPPRPDKKTGEPSNRYAFGAFHTVLFTPQAITEHLCVKGRAICVAGVRENWRKEEHFISAQLMGVDFDTGPDIDGLMHDSFIEDRAFLLYRTPSWTADVPRTRALFILDAPVFDVACYKRLLKRLLYKFNAANIDEQCKDAARIFFGSTQKGYSEVNSARIAVAELEALPPHPDELPKPPPAPRQPVDTANKSRAEAYAIATREGILNEALATPAGAGLRHKAFNAAVMKLIAREDWPCFEAIDSAIHDLGRALGRDDDEIERSLRGAKTDANRIPLTLPEDAPAPPVTVAAPPVSSATWHTSDDSMAALKQRMITPPAHGRTPLPFPFRILWGLGGFCRAVPPGILIGVLGTSGGMKTSFCETMVDRWRQLAPNHVLWWGAEWNWEKMADRAVQRYSNVTMTDLMLHEMWLAEDAAAVPTAKRYGVKLSPTMLAAVDAAADKVTAWPGKNHYLDQMDVDIETLLDKAKARVTALADAGTPIQIAVFDYVQLLNLRSAKSEGDRITQVQGLIKAFCVDYQLIGVVASQVTKAHGTAARDGSTTLDAEAGQFQRSDKFNLVLTLNPTYSSGLLTDKAVLRVAKHSAGVSNVEKHVYINPSRFLWEDKEVEIAPATPPQTEDIEF